MTVWQLDRQINDFRTLHSASVIAGDESGILELSKSFFGDTPLAATWVTPAVVYYENEGIKGDFPHFWGADCPVFTRQAMTALRELVAPFGEFLPLACDEEEFTAFKVLRFIEALDVERSEIQWFRQLPRERGQPKRVEKIKRFVFREELLAGAVIFRLPQLPTFQVFVTDAFVNCVRAADLKGFLFRQVWPTPAPALDPRVVRTLEARKRQPSAGASP